MGRLNKEFLEKVKATIGALSPITEREATGDKSVTIDPFEKEVLFSVYVKKVSHVEVEVIRRVLTLKPQFMCIRTMTLIALN